MHFLYDPPYGGAQGHIIKERCRRSVRPSVRPSCFGPGVQNEIRSNFRFGVVGLVYLCVFPALRL